MNIPPTYSKAHISRVMNDACDEIADVADLPETGTRDALNLLVNAVRERLDDPDLPLASIVEHNYSIDDDLDEHRDAPTNERHLRVVVGWIGGN